jgi:mannose-1-phosphate guanylyltransferase/mannose-6-phosphate isomerase
VAYCKINIKIKLEYRLFRLIPVVLSGGSGTRLWPLSRSEYPKQHLSLTGSKTMLQETIMRLNGLNYLEDPVIVCNSNHRFLVAEQCKQVGVKNPKILLEPLGRNTAPAVAAAALYTLKSLDNATLIVLSADHFIEDVEKFHYAINTAIDYSNKGKLITFGVLPLNPNTEYGYIKTSKKEIDKGVFIVEKFVEKPDLETAEEYVKKKNYLWNSGIFMFQAKTLVSELSKYAPKIVKSVSKSINMAIDDLDFIRLDYEAFKSSPADSIDYALMEKSKEVMVVSLDSNWTDVGSWRALYDIEKKDENGNVLKGDVIIQNTHNSYINASNHLLAIIGVENLIVVDTPDATLIAHKDRVSDIKSIVENLKVRGRPEINSHLKVFRPWGWYDLIESGENFQVKRLCVRPSAKLSLQKHNKRAEHWVVIKGVAKVTQDNKIFLLNKGESTFIPVGVIHALENESEETLEVIEVQSGTYLGEDDIVRFDDIYGRVND